MTPAKALLINIFLYCLVVGQVEAQVICDDIEVDTSITEPSDGKSNGKVVFNFKDKGRSYKIFLINKGEKEARTPIKNSQIENLRVGFYDFVIADDRGCIKQLTIILKGN